MKKFIKALEDKGIMEKIIDSGIRTEKMTGRPVEQGGLETILGFEAMRNKDLEEIFIQESHAIAMNSIFKYVQKQIVERQKVEALVGVDTDALYAKATGKTPSKEAEPKEEMNIEDFIMNSIAESVGDALGELFKTMLTESMK